MKVIYCKQCGMPSTRPGIHFENGICQGCLWLNSQLEINWDKRWRELEQFISNHPSESKYDCVIAVSGGKDSHFQTYIFKEKLGLNCLLVCVEDGFSKTKAGIHNLNNLTEAFDCDLLDYRMRAQARKKIMRYTFEKYGRPNYIIDRLIYTVPVWIAIELKIPIVVYGENVAVTRGLKDNRDIPIAWNQMYNTVASNYPLKEIAQNCGIKMEDLKMAEFPPERYMQITTPIYTSYFVRWDGFKNYILAKSRGFKSLEGEWNRLGGNINYWQIDTYGYLIDSYLKFMKFGHSYITDLTCELRRFGWMSEDIQKDIIEKYEGEVNNLMLEDFCKTLGYSQKEFYDICEKFYNKEYHDKV